MKLAVISARAGLPDPPIFLVVSAIVTVLPHYFNYAVLAAVSLDSYLLFTWVKGAMKFLEGMLHDCERYTGKYSPCLLV